MKVIVNSLPKPFFILFRSFANEKVLFVVEKLKKQSET